MPEPVRLGNLPREMLSGFPGSFGVEGEAMPTTKAADVLDAGHGTKICPSVPFRRRYWKPLRSNFIGQGRRLELSLTLCPRTKCARSQRATSRRAVSGPWG